MSANINPRAGKIAEPSMLANIPRLVTAYFAGKPDPSLQAQRVAFGTSGHRGSAFNNAFNEAHILAISQAVCDHRRSRGITGPLFVGIDTHALAEPALASALEVFAANGVEVMIDAHDGYTPQQRFFISYGQIWCQNVTDQEARRLAIIDPHSPGRWRVNGAVQNSAGFAEAFGCKAGQPMVRENACRVW